MGGSIDLKIKSGFDAELIAFEIREFERGARRIGGPAGELERPGDSKIAGIGNRDVERGADVERPAEMLGKKHAAVLVEVTGLGAEKDAVERAPRNGRGGLERRGVARTAGGDFRRISQIDGAEQRLRNELGVGQNAELRADSVRR